MKTLIIATILAIGSLFALPALASDLTDNKAAITEMGAKWHEVTNVEDIKLIFDALTVVVGEAPAEIKNATKTVAIAIGGPQGGAVGFFDEDGNALAAGGIPAEVAIGLLGLVKGS